MDNENSVEICMLEVFLFTGLWEIMEAQIVIKKHLSTQEVK